MIKILDAQNIKNLLDEDNHGFSEQFKKDFVTYFDDIVKNPAKYHLQGAGMSIRNKIRQVSEGGLRKMAGDPLWLDKNWLKIAKELYPHIKKEIG